MDNTIRLPEINRITVAGRATRAAETKFTQGGTGIASFDLAVNRRFKDKSGEWKDDVSYVSVTSFGEYAEKLAARIPKGAAVLVEGRVKSDSWEDKEGNKRSKVFIIADRVQVLTKSED